MQSETQPRRRQNRTMPDPNLKLIGDSTSYSQFRCKVNEILLVEHLEKIFKYMKTKLVAQKPHPPGRTIRKLRTTRERYIPRSAYAIPIRLLGRSP